MPSWLKTMTKMQLALDSISKEIEKALFLKYDARKPCLEAAFKAYIEGFKAHVRKEPGEDQVLETSLLINVISQALDHPSLEASSYALNGLLHVVLRVKEVFNDMTTEKADELYEHLDTCGFMTWGIGDREELAEYDADVPDGYVAQQMAEYRAARDAHYKKFMEEHPDAFKDYYNE